METETTSQNFTKSRHKKKHPQKKMIPVKKTLHTNYLDPPKDTSLKITRWTPIL